MESRPEQGYALVDRRGAPRGEAYGHELCGPTTTAGAICPNCDKPILTLARLDAEDPRLELVGTGLGVTPLLFCWTCEASQEPLIYELLDQGEAIQLLQWRSGSRFTDFPYSDYPRAFPRQAIGLRPLDPVEQRVLSALNRDEQSWQLTREYPDLSRPRHQVGGEPLLLQRVEPQECTKCGKPSPLFASIGDMATDNRRFTGNDFVQVLFHVCRSCLVVTAYQLTD